MSGKRKKPGPCAEEVRILPYLLPDGSPDSGFSDEKCSLLLEHANAGYGKIYCRSYYMSNTLYRYTVNFIFYLPYYQMCTRNG